MARARGQQIAHPGFGFPEMHFVDNPLETAPDDDIRRPIPHFGGQPFGPLRSHLAAIEGQRQGLGQPIETALDVRPGLEGKRVLDHPLNRQVRRMLRRAELNEGNAIGADPEAIIVNAGLHLPLNDRSEIG